MSLVRTAIARTLSGQVSTSAAYSLALSNRLPHMLHTEVSFSQQAVVRRAKPPQVVARIRAAEGKRSFVMQL